MKKGNKLINIPLAPFRKGEQKLKAPSRRGWGCLAFTLVELIVTITILAILGTIGFMSFQNYTVYARDVVRITDLSNMKSALEYSFTQNSRYPEPDNAEEVKYEGTTVWKQGTFGKKVRRITKSLNEVPTDPKYLNEYTFSVSDNGQEYELAGAYEGDEVVLNKNILKSSYAEEEKLKTRLIGNYNGKVKLIRHNGADYALALPSLVAIDLSDTDLKNIVSNKKLTYNGYNSLPASYGNQEPPEKGSFEFVPNTLVIWSGSLSELKETGKGFEKLSAGLYKAYLGTNLYLKGDEYKYIDSSDVVKYILKSSPEEGKFYKSCKEIKQARKEATQDGCYDIKGNYKSANDCLTSGNTEEQYYCNMTKDGGGWTLYVKIKGDYDIGNSRKCILGEKINNDTLYCRVPFAFGKNKELWYQDLYDNKEYIVNINEPFVQNTGSRRGFYLSTYFDFDVRTSEFENNDFSNAFVWFGFSYDHNHSLCGLGRHAGGISPSEQYQNYDSGEACFGPKAGGREDHARQGEFYVR